MKKEQNKINQLATLEALHKEAYETKVEVETNNYGEIEVWNWIDCQYQNAEQESNDIVRHIESALCDESKELGAFFLKAGFNY